MAAKCRQTKLGRGQRIGPHAHVEGEWLGVARNGLVKVRWDGRRTIGRYHPDFIERLDDNRPKTKADLRAEILANRQLIRRAFDLVRYEPNEKLLTNTLAGALGGRFEITDSILDTARQIIAERKTRQSH